MALYKVKSDAANQQKRYCEKKIAVRLRAAQEAGNSDAIHVALDANEDGELCAHEKADLKRFLHAAAIKSTTLRALDKNGDGVLCAGETRGLKNLAEEKLKRIRSAAQNRDPA